MSRRTVRVEIPVNSPEALMVLLAAILAREEDPTGTPEADPAQISKLAALQSAVQIPHTKAKALDAQAQTLRQQRDTKLGVAAGQNMETPDTALNLITRVRDALLVKYHGNEEALSNWGFNVIVGEAKAPTRKAKPQA